MDRSIDDIISKYKSGRREELIPILQEINEDFGYLPEEAVIKIGNLLNLSTTKIYGLSTFYDQFRFFPAGRIHLRICHGTSCFLNGSQGVINRIREELGIEPGETTRDGIFSYEIVTCMGGCNNGPVISVNGDYHTHLRPEQLPELISRLKYMLENV
jgi:NADH:ubiquinone oxidoreductase subunit E